MSRPRRVCLWIILGVATGIGIFLVLYCYLNSLDEPSRILFTASIDLTVRLLTLAFVVIGGLVALERLRTAQQSRELQLVLPILERFMDDPSLAETRSFVYDHANDLDDMVRNTAGHEPLDAAAYKAARETIDRKIVYLSKGRQSLGTIYGLVNSLNHVSALLDTHLSQSSWFFDFHDPILGMWETLGPLVILERQWRRDKMDDKVNFFGTRLELLAQRMLARPFAEELQREQEHRHKARCTSRSVCSTTRARVRRVGSERCCWLCETSIYGSTDRR